MIQAHCNPSGPYKKDAGRVGISGGGLTMDSGTGVTCSEDGGSHPKPKEYRRPRKRKKARKEIVSPEPPAGISLSNSGLDHKQNDFGLLISKTLRVKTVILGH